MFGRLPPSEVDYVRCNYELGEIAIVIFLISIVVWLVVGVGVWMNRNKQKNQKNAWLTWLVMGIVVLVVGWLGLGKLWCSNWVFNY